MGAGAEWGASPWADIARGGGDGQTLVTVGGNDYKLARRLVRDIWVFSVKPLGAEDSSQIQEWERLLADPAIFKGVKHVRKKRKLQKHEPENPHEHGMAYVLGCFKKDS